MSAVTDPRGDLQWGTIPALVEDAAARFGESEALADAHGPDGSATRLTFDQLADEVAAATRAIVACGIDRGDRVAVWAPNCAEWVIAALGTVAAGAVLVPLDPELTGEQAAAVLRRSGARLLLTVEGTWGTDHPALLAHAAAAGHRVPGLERVVLLRTAEGSTRPPTAQGDPVVDWETFLQEGRLCSADVAAGRTASITPADPADLGVSPGTTGRPRGAVATHGQSLRAYATWAEVVGLQKGDRCLVVTPLCRVAGFKAGVLSCLMTGAAIVPEPGFDIDRLVRRIESERITVLCAPPDTFRAVLDHPDRKKVDISSLRLLVSAAAVPLDLVRSLRSDLGVESVLASYGPDQACGVATICRRGDGAEAMAGTSGRAIPDVRVRIVGPEGNEHPRGEGGEIQVRGYNVLRGYFDDDADQQVVDPSGWLHTGDLGSMDPADNLTVTHVRGEPVPSTIGTQRER